MKDTLQTMQVLLGDIKGDVELLSLTPVVNKVELVLQLLEGVVRELGEGK